MINYEIFKVLPKDKQIQVIKSYIRRAQKDLDDYLINTPIINNNGKLNLLTQHLIELEGLLK